MNEEKHRPEPEQLLELLQSLLSHDKVMARCVLGRYESVLKDDEEFEARRTDSFLLIKWMGNLMTLAAAFLYSKFNLWRTETGAHPTDKARPNSLYLKRLLAGVQSTDKYFDQPSSGLRVLRVLNGIYDSFDMNFFVVKYIIVNSQIESGFNCQGEPEEQRGLSQLIGFPHEKSLRATCNFDKKKFKKDGRNLAAAFNYVFGYRNNPNFENTFDLTGETIEIECAFEDVFYTMEFMKRIKLEIDSDGIVNFKETKINGEIIDIPSHGVVRLFIGAKNDKHVSVYKPDESPLPKIGDTNLPRDCKVEFYLLEKIEYFQNEKTIDAAVRFSYQAFDESNSVSAYFSEKEELIPEDCVFKIPTGQSAMECYSRICGYLPGTRFVSSFFRGMLMTHYRYHNILAPSIVDAIDEDREAKCRILQQIVKDNEPPFREGLAPTFRALEFALGKSFCDDWDRKIDSLCDDYIQLDDYRYRRIIDWDTLIARILIYEGPSEIVRTILLDDKKTHYESYDKERIEKTCNRIIAGLEMRYIDNIFDAEAVSKDREANYDNNFKQKIEDMRNLFPGYSVTKLECKALAQSYIDTIVNTLTKIEEQKTGIASNKFAENCIQDTLEILKEYRGEKHSQNAEHAFLRTVKTFFSFYAGILNCCRSRMNYEFEKSITILSPTAIEEWQGKIEKDFFDGVSSEAKKLFKDFSKGNAIKTAIKKLWNFANMPFDEAKLYKAILARTPIDIVRLAKVFSLESGNVVFMNKGESIHFEEARENNMLIECLENIANFLVGMDPSGKSNNNKNIDKSNHTGYKEHARRIIYPQIVTFAKHREDCDANNCLIMDHNGAFAEWHNGEVQILTEFKYKINHAYYAMPNLNRIETEWWVDPILIPCHRFDEEMRKVLGGGKE